MPRELYDADGNAVEGIPDDAELKALQQTASEKAEADKKVGEFEAKMKEIEGDPAYKNLGVLREKWKTAEKERDEWKGKAEALGGEQPPKPISQDEVKTAAEAAAEKIYLNKLVERELKQFGDQKDVVKKIFDKLTAGEQLTEEKVEEHLQTAAKAAGLAPTRSSVPTYQGGGAPKFDNDDKSFADTDEGKARAKAQGWDFAQDNK